MRSAGGGGPETRVSGSELPRAAERGEERRVELDVVPAGGEVVEDVGVRGSRFAEHEAVLAAAAAYVVVAGAAFDPVGAVVSAHHVIARAAEHGVVAVATQQRVVAAQAVDRVRAGRAGEA